MARVEARLRAAHPKERAVRLGPLRMNLLSGRAYIGETDLNLTQKELRRCCIWRGTRTAASARRSCTRRSGSSRWEPTRMPCA